MKTPSSSGIPLRIASKRKSASQSVAQRLQAEIDRSGSLKSNSSSISSQTSNETDYSERNRSMQSATPAQKAARGSGKHSGASQRILSYFRENANVEIPGKDIQKALGLPDYTVSNGVTHLMAKGIPIRRVMAGVYIFSPNSHNRQTDQPPKNSGTQAFYAALKRDVKLYEYVGVAQGKTVVRGEDDELYILSPLFEVPNG